MAGHSVDLAVRIAVDAQNAGQQIEQAAGGASKFGDKMSKLAAPAGIAAGAIIAFGKGAVDAASSVQQGLGAVGSVFGENAGQVTAWSENAAQSAGLAQSSYLEMASKIGAQLNNMGVDAAGATAGTDKLITMGADLAATFGGSTADAVDALGAAMKGEADSAEKYGLNLSASAVAARMAADGTDKLTGEALTAAKAQTIMAMATEQSGAAVGAFARESDTAEGASARASAQWENTQATLGAVLLPAVTAVSTALGVMAKWMQDNATVTQVIIGVMAAAAVAILAVSVATKVAAAGQAIWTAAQWAWNAAMSANPVGLVIIAVIALVAGFVLLWNKCEGFRSFILGMWEAIKSAAVACWQAIEQVVTSVVNAIKTAITAAGQIIKSVWAGVQSVASTIWNAIKSMIAGVINGIIGVVSAISGTISAVWATVRSAAESAWNAIGSVVSAVTGAITGFVNGMLSAITSVWDAIKSAGMAVWGPIRDAASSALNGIMSIINSVSSAIDSVIGAIQSAMSWVSDLWGKITGASDAAANIPTGVAATSGGFAAVPASVSPSLNTSARAAPAGGSTTVINVTGALFPDETARAIDNVLRRRDRRRQGVFV